MDNVTEVGQKMRSAIKAKLIELGSYVDDELPDYIMVMVANRRTKDMMVKDLQLFLSDNTVQFVNWLHQVLKKLQEVTVSNIEKAKLARQQERLKRKIAQVDSAKQQKLLDEMRNTTNTRPIKVGKLKSDTVVKKKGQKLEQKSSETPPVVSLASKPPETTITQTRKSNNEVIDPEISLTPPRAPPSSGDNKKQTDTSGSSSGSDSSSGDESSQSEGGNDSGDDFINLNADNDLVKQVTAGSKLRNNTNKVKVKSEKIDSTQLSPKKLTVHKTPALLTKKLHEKPSTPEVTSSLPSNSLQTSQNRVENVEELGKTLENPGDKDGDKQDNETPLPKPKHKRITFYSDDDESDKKKSSAKTTSSWRNSSSSSNSNLLSRVHNRERPFRDRERDSAPYRANRRSRTPDKNSLRTRYDRGRDNYSRGRNNRDRESPAREKRTTNAIKSQVVSVVKRKSESPAPKSTGGLSSIVQVEPRPPRRSITSKNILLKAVADAQKSITSSKIAKTSNENDSREKDTKKPPIKRASWSSTEEIPSKSGNQSKNDPKTAIILDSPEIVGTKSKQKFIITLNGVNEDMFRQKKRKHTPTTESDASDSDEKTRKSPNKNRKNHQKPEKTSEINTKKLNTSNDSTKSSRSKRTPSPSPRKRSRSSQSPKSGGRSVKNIKRERIERSKSVESVENSVKLTENKQGRVYENFERRSRSESLETQRKRIIEEMNRRKREKLNADDKKRDELSRSPIKRIARKNSASESEFSFSSESSGDGHQITIKTSSTRHMRNDQKTSDNESYTNKSSSSIQNPGKSLNALKIKERCQYWPACKQGDIACEYIHPSSMCKLFPNCKFGCECLFVHPNCKYDTSCSRTDCTYSHGIADLVEKIVKKEASHSAGNHGSHGGSSSHSQHSQTICKYYPNCSNSQCNFYHPKVCRYGKNCTNLDCRFSHTSGGVKYKN